MMVKYVEVDRTIEIALLLLEEGEDEQTLAYNAALVAFIKNMENVPTADVAEVQHGKWLDVEPAPHNLFYATCSVCGDRQTIEVANYCPMCGASMDEVEE